MWLLQVRKAIQAMELPNNALDEVIDLLGGPEHVAEMTGGVLADTAF